MHNNTKDYNRHHQARSLDRPQQKKKKKKKGWRRCWGRLLLPCMMRRAEVAARFSMASYSARAAATGAKQQPWNNNNNMNSSPSSSQSIIIDMGAACSIEFEETTEQPVVSTDRPLSTNYPWPASSSSSLCDKQAPAETMTSTASLLHPPWPSLSSSVTFFTGRIPSAPANNNRIGQQPQQQMQMQKLMEEEENDDDDDSLAPIFMAPVVDHTQFLLSTGSCSPTSTAGRSGSGSGPSSPSVDLRLPHMPPPASSSSLLHACQHILSDPGFPPASLQLIYQLYPCHSVARGPSSRSAGSSSDNPSPAPDRFWLVRDIHDDHHDDATGCSTDRVEKEFSVPLGGFVKMAAAPAGWDSRQRKVVSDGSVERHPVRCREMQHSECCCSSSSCNIHPNRLGDVLLGGCAAIADHFPQDEEENNKRPRKTSCHLVPKENNRDACCSMCWELSEKCRRLSETLERTKEKLAILENRVDILLTE